MSGIRWLLFVEGALLQLSLILCGQAGADDDEQSHEKVTVFAQVLPTAADQPPCLSITADVAQGWHLFFITQKPGGPKRTRIELDESKDYKLSWLWTADPAPQIKSYDDIWPKLPVEEHEHRVVWTAPLMLAAGVDATKLVIKGRVHVQCCQETFIDVTSPFEARRKEGGAGAQARLDGK